MIYQDHLYITFNASERFHFSPIQMLKPGSEFPNKSLKVKSAWAHVDFKRSLSRVTFSTHIVWQFMSEVYVFWPSCWRWLTVCWMRMVVYSPWLLTHTWHLTERLRGPRVPGPGPGPWPPPVTRAPDPRYPLSLSHSARAPVQGCKREHLERSILSGKYEQGSTWCFKSSCQA